MSLLAAKRVRGRLVEKVSLLYREGLSRSYGLRRQRHTCDFISAAQTYVIHTPFTLCDLIYGRNNHFLRDPKVDHVFD